MLLTIITTVILNKQDHNQWCAHNLILLKPTQVERSVSRKNISTHDFIRRQQPKQTIWAFWWWEMSCLHHPKWIIQTLKFKGASPIVPLDKQPCFEKKHPFQYPRTHTVPRSGFAMFMWIQLAYATYIYIYIHTWLLNNQTSSTRYHFKAPS